MDIVHCLIPFPFPLRYLKGISHCQPQPRLLPPPLFKAYSLVHVTIIYYSCLEIGSKCLSASCFRHVTPCWISVKISTFEGKGCRYLEHIISMYHILTRLSRASSLQTTAERQYHSYFHVSGVSSEIWKVISLPQLSDRKSATLRQHSIWEEFTGQMHTWAHRDWSSVHRMCTGLHQMGS